MQGNLQHTAWQPAPDSVQVVGPVGGPAVRSNPDYTRLSHRAYGPRVGIFHLLDSVLTSLPRRQSVWAARGAEIVDWDRQHASEAPWCSPGNARLHAVRAASRQHPGIPVEGRPEGGYNGI